MDIKVSGHTIYELDPDGVNRWSANVQPGVGLDGYRQPDSVVARVAERLYTADLYHERLVKALFDMTKPSGGTLSDNITALDLLDEINGGEAQRYGN